MTIDFSLKVGTRCETHRTCDLLREIETQLLLGRTNSMIGPSLPIVARKKAIELMMGLGFSNPNVIYQKFFTLGGELKEQKIGSRYFVTVEELESWK